MRGAWVALSSSQMLLPVAKEAGYFETYGLEFDLTYIAGSTTALAALLGGDIQALDLGGTTVVNAAAGGADVSIIGIFLNQIIFQVVSTPEVKTLADVRGKAVAVSKLGNTDHLVWHLIGSQQGWKDSDLHFVPAGDVAGQLAMLQSGQAQAAAMSPPNEVAFERAGFHVVYTLPEEEEKNVLAVSRKYAAEHRPEVLSLLKAGVAAASRLKHDAGFAKDVMRKYLKQTDQALLDAGYNAYAQLWITAPVPDAQAFTKVVNEAAIQNPKAKSVNLDTLLDPSFVKELDSSGFLKQFA
ncbi:MAG TPA: ABC transporter substrate-binding protein [Chloroflexota bacterium]|nr:ABC transporter substrate-binding protein [Chloroflexota bacterium]